MCIGQLALNMFRNLIKLYCATSTSLSSAKVSSACPFVFDIFEASSSAFDTVVCVFHETRIEPDTNIVSVVWRPKLTANLLE